MNVYVYISTNSRFAQGGVLSVGMSLSRLYSIPYHPALSLILFYIDYLTSVLHNPCYMSTSYFI
jgi:hypothetical protein